MVKKDEFIDIEGLDLMAMEYACKHNEVDSIPPMYIILLVITLQNAKASQQLGIQSISDKMGKMW